MMKDKTVISPVQSGILNSKEELPELIGPWVFETERKVMISNIEKCLLHGILEKMYHSVRRKFKRDFGFNKKYLQNNHQWLLVQRLHPIYKKVYGQTGLYCDIEYFLEDLELDIIDWTKTEDY